MDDIYGSYVHPPNKQKFSWNFEDSIKRKPGKPPHPLPQLQNNNMIMLGENFGKT